MTKNNSAPDIIEIGGVKYQKVEEEPKEPQKSQSQMTEIEKTEGEIKVLQAKLELLKEMEKHKTPCEEAFKRLYTYYPVTDITDPCWDGSTWTHFVNGYKSAQEDYKVGEFQPTPIETLCYYDDPEHLPYFVGN